jgi:uncharacterized membrane protein
MFSMIPSLDVLHPMVVHFPIGLLLVVPLFALGGLVVSKRYGDGLLLAALGLMFLGTVSAWVSVVSGHAAAELAERTPEISAAIEVHERLGGTVAVVFTILTILYAVLLAVPLWIKRPLRRSVILGLHAGFLVLYLAGMGVVAATGHQGGMLVHKYGVHALTTGGDASAAAAAQPASATAAD